MSANIGDGDAFVVLIIAVFRGHSSTTKVSHREHILYPCGMDELVCEIPTWHIQPEPLLLRPRPAWLADNV